MNVYKNGSGSNLEKKEANFNNFLNKIIIYSSKEYYRSQIKRDTRELKILDDTDYEEYLKNYIKIEDNISLKSDVWGDFCENEELNIALKSLSAIEQSVIFLVFNEELSQDEAGKILKICSKSVSRIKLRAIDKLKKYLKGDNK